MCFMYHVQAITFNSVYRVCSTYRSFLRHSSGEPLMLCRAMLDGLGPPRLNFWGPKHTIHSIAFNIQQWYNRKRRLFLINVDESMLQCIYRIYRWHRYGCLISKVMNRRIYRTYCVFANRLSSAFFNFWPF